MVTLTFLLSASPLIAALTLVGRILAGGCRLLDRKHRACLRTFKALKSHGLLLESDSTLPSVARIVVGRRLRTSWWADRRADLIHGVLQQLRRSPDVLTTKLVGGKVTFVHRELWPALFAVATSGEPWQRIGLSPTGGQLLSLVSERGMLETNRLPGYQRRSKPMGEAARELERRLLVYGEEFHTESGAHAKRLRKWQGWARRVSLGKVAMTPEEGRRKLEDALDRLGRSKGYEKLLPWYRK
jgi:hypothetical protein